MHPILPQVLLTNDGRCKADTMAGRGVEGGVVVGKDVVMEERGRLEHDDVAWLDCSVF